MRPRRLVALGAALTAMTSLAAATAGATSRYSLHGTGEAVLPGRADARALGGAEAAAGVPSLSGNPASLALTDQTRFYGTWITDWTRSEEPRTPGVLKEYSGFIPNLGLVFPIPGDLRLGLGLLVERRQGGKIVRDATTPDGRPYQQVFEAKGNLLRIPVQLARRAGPVQLGGGLDVLLLNSTIQWRNTFPAGSGFASSDDRDERGIWGAAWKAGARIPLGSKLALGAWGSFPGQLSGTRRLRTEANTDSSGTLRIDSHEDIARETGVGVEVTPARGWRVVGDWTREGWKDVAPPSPVDEFVDVNRLGVGVEWSPAASSGLQWPVRLGFRTEPLHTLDSAGRKVNERALSAGSGFSFADGRGEFDWFVEYAWRGQRDVSEFYEQSVRLGVTLTGFEEWSGRRPPEDAAGDW